MLSLCLYIASLFPLLIGATWISILEARKDPRSSNQRYRRKVIGVMFVLTIALIIAARLLI